MKRKQCLASLAIVVLLSGCAAPTGAQDKSRGKGCKNVPLVVTTTSLPDATEGRPYSFQLAATGGCPPYHWRIAFGALPAGLVLSDAGLISGTPTIAGTYAFGSGTRFALVVKANPEGSGMERGN